jgi:hypothetical protein
MALCDGIHLGVAVKPSNGDLRRGALHDEDYGFPGYRLSAGEHERIVQVPLRMWGRPYPVLTFPAEAEAQPRPPKRVSRRAVAELGPPSWLQGVYRPRALTPVGALALERLAPMGGGLRGYPLKAMESLSVRRDFLAMRYVALDLLRMGLVYELNGSYHHIDSLPERDMLAWEAKYALPRSTSRIHETDLLAWLAVTRSLSLDQFVSIDPENAFNNVELMFELVRQRLVDVTPISLGKGKWDGYGLSASAWRWLRKEHPELQAQGFGPRRAIGSNRDLHESLQADAIMWFAHAVQDAGGEVVDVALERALKREGENLRGEKFFDVRLTHVNSLGLRGIQEIEVVGIGNHYRRRAKIDLMRSSPVYRSFSSHAGVIALGDHVSVGR